jgi:hypothetical protein
MPVPHLGDEPVDDIGFAIRWHSAENYPLA